MVGEQPGLREEVLNVKLAELLSQSGLLSVPESILREDRRRRSPDITVGNFWGVRVIIERRIGSQRGRIRQLEHDCQRRIEEGIATIVIGVIYPHDLRHAKWAELQQTLRETTLRIRVFSEAGESSWLDSDFDGLSAILRRAYEVLVDEDVVSASVQELREGIEAASRELAGSPGTMERLRNILVMPLSQETDDNNE
jgi:hypothetical protein